MTASGDQHLYSLCALSALSLFSFTEELLLLSGTRAKLGLGGAVAKFSGGHGGWGRQGVGGGERDKEGWASYESVRGFGFLVAQSTYLRGRERVWKREGGWSRWRREDGGGRRIEN